MKTVAVMPIKLNNERLPGKNTRELGNRPLLQYALETVIKTKLCDEVYVYCSDDKICKYIPNKACFLKREKKLDLPASNFTQIFDCFRREIKADIYVYIHATAPYISLETMKACIRNVQSMEYDSAFCAVKIQDFLWKGGKPFNFNAEEIPRSQDLEPIYRETSGIYVFRKEVFEQYHRRIGKTPYMKQADYIEAVDINTLEDFELAQALFERYMKRKVVLKDE